MRNDATLLAVRLRTIAAAFGLVLACGCTAPTLPLPPPEEPSITASTMTGKVHLHSNQGAAGNAIVIAFNTNPNVPREQRVTGTQADASGSWEMDVIATAGDALEISQQVGDKDSASITVQVPK